MITKSDIKHSLSDVKADETEMILEIAANFHIRNGVQHPDGSFGEVRITYKELLDALAYAIKNATRNYVVTEYL